MNKLTPNQKELIKMLITDIMELNTDVEINKFFSLYYKDRKYKKKNQYHFFKDFKKLPKKEVLISLIKEARYNNLLENGLIKEYQIRKKGPFYVRPTFIAFQGAIPEDFRKFLDFLELQFDKRIESFIEPKPLSSIQLTLFLFLIINGNVQRDQLLDISEYNIEIDKFLTPWLESFSNEINKRFFNNDSEISSRSLKAHFRTQISNINNAIGFPIKPAGNFQYYIKEEILDYTIDVLNQQLEKYDRNILQKILLKYFKSLNQLKGKMEMYGIKSYYVPVKISNILSKFYLKISSK